MKRYLETIGSKVVEVRILRDSPRMAGKFVGKTISGYYEASEFDKLVADIQDYENDPRTKGIYTTLHAVHPDCLFRSQNRLRDGSTGDLTSDHHITHFLAFPVDIDAKRIAGISASESELEDAGAAAGKIADVLEALDIPFLKALSGNGYHIVVLLEQFENTPENADRFKTLGDRMAEHFGTDTSIYNPSRIWKLYGTTTRKGDNTKERPHRKAHIWLTDNIQQIAFDDLKAKLDSHLPAPERKPEPKKQSSRRSSSQPDISLAEWLREHNVAHQEPKRLSNGSIRYQMDCPFNPDHKAPDAAVIDTGHGWAFKCLHNSCEHRDWHDFKAKVAPETSERKRTKAEVEKKLSLSTDKDSLSFHHHDDRDRTTSASAAQTDREDNLGLPEIFLNAFDEGGAFQDRRRYEVSDDAVGSLKKDESMTRRGDFLGIIQASGENTYSWIPAEKRHVTGALSRNADFLKIQEKKTRVLANPPSWIAEDILTSQNLRDFPEIKLIIQHPFFYEGEIVDAPGLHKPSGFFRIPETYIDVAVPDTPKDALALLVDILEDVPFSEEADLENALSIPLTMIVRPSFPAGEMVPLAAINAASPGTGKSALAKILLISMLGSLPAATALSDDKEELRKSVFTMLVEGKNYALFDNLDPKKPLDSGQLASLISEPIHNGRLLGGNASGTFANLMSCIYTGNNVEASSELVDRGFLVQLDSPTERSVDRDFKHKEIFQYVLDNRPKILGAFVHLVGNWIENGCPQSKHRHRMQFWARTIGGIMEVNNFGKHFLENMMKFRRQADSDSPKWAQAFTSIYEQFGEEPFTISDIFTIVSYKKSYYHESSHIPEEGENLLGGLYDDIPQSDASRAKRVGHLFKTRVGQTLNNLKLLEAEPYGTRKRYQIEKINKE